MQFITVYTCTSVKKPHTDYANMYHKLHMGSLVERGYGLHDAGMAHVRWHNRSRASLITTHTLIAYKYM